MGGGTGVSAARKKHGAKLRRRMLRDKRAEMRAVLAIVGESQHGISGITDHDLLWTYVYAPHCFCAHNGGVDAGERKTACLETSAEFDRCMAAVLRISGRTSPRPAS